MNKYLRIHFIYWAVFCVLVILTRTYWRFDFIGFIIGGFLGTLLPDLDHYIFAYFIKPDDPVSKKIKEDVEGKRYMESWRTAVMMRNNTKGLLFHTAWFLALFLLFTLFTVTSSGRLLGHGLVLAFTFHVWLDMYLDYRHLKTIDHWYVDFPFNLDERQKIWAMWLGGFLLLLIGILF